MLLLLLVFVLHCSEVTIAFHCSIIFNRPNNKLVLWPCCQLYSEWCSLLYKYRLVNVGKTADKNADALRCCCWWLELLWSIGTWADDVHHGNTGEAVTIHPSSFSDIFCAVDAFIITGQRERHGIRLERDGDDF